LALLTGIEYHFNLDFNKIPIYEAEQYLKGLISKYANLIFNQNIEIYIKLEEGSLKVTLAVIGMIYIGIAQYGSFRSGIDYMIKDAKLLKELVTTEIIKNGMNEADIIADKRTYSDPDKIRRVLLGIERLESRTNQSNLYLNKELSKIKTSVRNILFSLSEEDKGLFIISIKKKYWPQDRDIPYFIERYKLVAREEDILNYPVANIEQHKVTNALQWISQ
jgi:hypothetical protein